MGEELKLNITMDGNELIVRQGEAAKPLPTREQQPVVIKGDIYTVAAYLEKRNAAIDAGLQAVNDDRAVIVVDKKKRTISLNTDPESYYGTKVTGELELSDELKQWGINEEKFYDKDALLKLVKANRYFFPNKEEHMKLVAALKNVRVKTAQEMNNSNDGRGAKAAGFEQVVLDNGNIPEGFGLHIQIFRGGEARLVPILLCFDVNGGRLTFWLESMELNEVMDTMLQQILAEEIAKCDGYLIVHA